MTKRKEKNLTIYALTFYALMSALICVFAPMSVPIGPIPVSLTNLILYFSIFIIGTKGTMISYIVYMLIGMIGLPVFSGYTGGLAKLAGPTGGYLIGFLPMILIMGVIYQYIEKAKISVQITVIMIGMIFATMVAYLFGTAWFVFQMECDWKYALGICVIPFIPFDICKMIIAIILGRKIRSILLKQGMLIL